VKAHDRPATTLILVRSRSARRGSLRIQPRSVPITDTGASELIADAAAFLPRATVVFVNAAEFAALATLTDPARLATVVISDGPHEVTVRRRGSTTAAARPPDTRALEVTGAGDTLAGTFLAGLARGLADDAALRAAVTAAAQSTRGPGLAISDH
jgi:sugar/nucleoside kinase (ribokinase family)